MSQPSGHDQHNCKRTYTVDNHPSPSKLTSRIHLLMFIWTPMEFIYHSRICLELFLKLVYPTIVAKKFQIHGVKITGKYICESKNWICSFLLMPSSKIIPQVLIITTPDRRKSNISPEQHLLKILLFPSRKEEDYGAEKITKIKLARILVTSFDKFHHFCNLDIFGFCFVVPQFKFKHVEMWKFFHLTPLIFTKKYSVQE